MYQEYAIDPTTICRTFDRFKLFWGGLGYGEGRLLSKFPGSWEKKALKSDTYNVLTELQQKRIEELLAREKFEKRRIVPSGREYDSNSPSWLDAAESAHAGKPFHAILAEGNPRKHKAVACFDDLGEDGDFWSVPRPWQIDRWHTNMANAAARLLLCSREILFVEPYFCFEERFTRPLKAFLEIVTPYANVIQRIEVHLKQSNPELSHDDFRDAFIEAGKQNLKHCCPRDGKELLKKVEFFIWENSTTHRMHPRYILTEVSGLGFEHGLDESVAGHEVCDINIVSGSSLQKRWEEFQETTSPRMLVCRQKFET